MKKYHIDITWIGNYGEEIYFDGIIELDYCVISNVDDDWRRTFYPSIITPQQIAEHIAFNMIVNDLKLSEIDGFANLSNEMAKL